MPVEEFKKKFCSDLKILVPALTRYFGEIERTILADIAQLQKERIFVVVLVLKGSILEEEVRKFGKGVQVESYSRIVKKFFDLSFVRKVRHIVRNYDIKLIHFHYQNLLSNLFFSVINKSHVALILTYHGLSNLFKRNAFYAFLLRRVDYILVFSETMRFHLLKNFAIRARKLRVIPLGIDLKYFHSRSWTDKGSLRKQWSIPEDAFLLGVLGDLSPKNSQDTVIKAMAQLQRELSSLYLVLVQREREAMEGSYEKLVRQLIFDFYLQDRVFLVKEEGSVGEIFSNLELFILPGAEEIWTRMALKAMALGVPSILTRSGGLGDLAGGGERALLFNSGDVFDLSCKIRQLYVNRDLQERLKKESRTFVEEFHSLKIYLEHILNVYARCARHRWEKRY